MIHEMGFLAWLSATGGALLFGALGYCLRFLIERSHAKEMEAIRAGFSQELEYLRSKLGERAIQFTKLHQDRVEEMIRIYDSLRDLQMEIHNYLLVVQHDSSANKAHARSEAYEKAYNKLKAAWRAYSGRRFYFTQAMAATIEAVFKPLFDIEQVTYGWHQSDVSAYDHGYDQSIRDSFKRDMEEAQNLKRTVLQAALAKLEESMRSVLGVESTT